MLDARAVSGRASRVGACRVGPRARADCRTAGADEEKSAAFVFGTHAVSGRVFQPRLQHGLSRRREKALSGEGKRVELEALVGSFGKGTEKQQKAAHKTKREKDRENKENREKRERERETEREREGKKERK